ACVLTQHSGAYAPISCHYFFYGYGHDRDLHSFPTRRSSDLVETDGGNVGVVAADGVEDRLLLSELAGEVHADLGVAALHLGMDRSEEHTSELQSLAYLVCRLLLEKKKE